MAIKIDEKAVGIWYVQTMPTQDWLASVREIEPDQKYELTYRFRYYDDDKVFDSEDRKNWYEATCSGTRSYVLASIRLVAQKLADAAGGQKVYEVVNDGDPQRMMREFSNWPCTYARMEAKP